MKVLLVVHQFLPRHVTGTEQYVRTVAQELREEGVETHVFAFEPLLDRETAGTSILVRDEIVEGVPVHRYGLHEDLSPNYSLRDYESPLATEVLSRYLDQNDFDVVHVFHLRNLGVGVIGAAKIRRIPVVVHLMDFWLLCPNYLLWHRSGRLCDGPPEGGIGCIECIDPALAGSLQADDLLDPLRAIGDLPTPAGVQTDSAVRKGHALVHRKERLFSALDDADLLVAPSRFLQSVFEREGVPASRIRHVPYGLDPGRFVDMPERKVTPGRPHLDVGYVGSISRHKGVHVLLEALEQIEDDRLRVHIYGRRFSQPGFSEDLIDSIADPRVTYHGPFAPTDLGKVLAGLDALAVPSLWYENTPFSVLEALSVDLPVLASDLGGISEIVRDGENGRLFPAGDSTALAVVLREMVGDPAGNLGVKHTDRVSIVDNSRSFVAMYRELCARQAGAVSHS